MKNDIACPTWTQNKENKMVQRLHEVRDRTGNLVIENATAGEIRDKCENIRWYTGNMNIVKERAKC